MISADDILIDGNTGWLVLTPSKCDSHIPDLIDIWSDFDRPCDTCEGEQCHYCGGSERDYHTMCDPCQICIEGRYTFNIQTENPHCAAAWPDHSIDDYNPYCCRWPKSCSARPLVHRVSIVPDMIIPITKPNDDWDAPKPEITMYPDGTAGLWTRTGSPHVPFNLETVIMPPGACPGRWAVKLNIKD